MHTLNYLSDTHTLEYQCNYCMKSMHIVGFYDSIKPVSVSTTMKINLFFKNVSVDITSSASVTAVDLSEVEL